MNPIRTDQEIVEWAKDVFNAKGEKFTPLTKGDQYAIAQYILANLNTADNGGTGTEPRAVDEGEPLPVEGEPLPEATGTEVEEVKNPDLIDPHADWGKGEADPQETPEEPKKEADGEKGIIRRQLLVNRGIDTPQKAFDEFLKYTERHREEAVVIDFSNGIQSTAAAFAWWLTQRID